MEKRGDMGAHPKVPAHARRRRTLRWLGWGLFLGTTALLLLWYAGLPGRLGVRISTLFGVAQEPVDQAARNRLEEVERRQQALKEGKGLLFPAMPLYDMTHPDDLDEPLDPWLADDMPTTAPFNPTTVGTSSEHTIIGIIGDSFEDPAPASQITTGINR